MCELCKKEANAFDLSEFNVNDVICLETMEHTNVLLMTQAFRNYLSSLFNPDNVFFTSMKFSYASYIMSSIKVIFSWGWTKRSFLNLWVIRRTLVCSVVSGHDINIEF